jgi:hypothetical protein
MIAFSVVLMLLIHVVFSMGGVWGGPYAIEPKKQMETVL